RRKGIASRNTLARQSRVTLTRRVHKPSWSRHCIEFAIRNSNTPARDLDAISYQTFASRIRDLFLPSTAPTFMTFTAARYGGLAHASFRTSTVSCLAWTFLPEALNLGRLAMYIRSVYTQA